MPAAAVGPILREVADLGQEVARLHAAGVR